MTNVLQEGLLHQTFKLILLGKVGTSLFPLVNSTKLILYVACTLLKGTTRGIIVLRSTSKPTRVSLSLIECPIHMSLCYV